MPIVKKSMRRQVSKPKGMCPNMTTPKKKKRKKPNPYRAPITVKRYYAGINFGIDLLKENLLSNIDDEKIQTIIKESSTMLKRRASLTLTRLEKEKTKQKIKEWEEKEWASI